MKLPRVVVLAPIALLCLLLSPAKGFAKGERTWKELVPKVYTQVTNRQACAKVDPEDLIYEWLTVDGKRYTVLVAEEEDDISETVQQLMAGNDRPGVTMKFSEKDIFRSYVLGGDNKLGFTRLATTWAANRCIFVFFAPGGSEEVSALVGYGDDDRWLFSGDDLTSYKPDLVWAPVRPW